MQSSQVIDFPNLSQELLRAIRGRTAQGLIDRRLGLTYAQTYRWESGRKKIYWGDFLQFCQACRSEEKLQKAIRNILRFSGSTNNASVLFQALVGSEKPAQLMSKLEISKSQAYRWSSGDERIPLAYILKAIHLYNRSLFPFLRSIVAIENLPSITEQARMQAEENDFYHQHPLSAAILISLNTPQYLRLYQHNSNVISKLVGESSHLIDKYLQNMLELGMVQKKGGKYYVSPKSLNLYSNYKDEYNLRNYWTQRASLKLEKASNKLEMSRFGFRVFTVKKNRYDHVMKKLTSIYQDMVNALYEDISSENTDSIDEKIFVFNLQLFNLESNEQDFSFKDK